MTPLSAIDRAIARAFTHSDGRLPGAVIERCSPAVRDALVRLTAEDLGRLRLDAMLPTVVAFKDRA